MSEVKVNKITPTADCGTVTLGDSGDTVAIPAGVTLTSGGALQNSGTITNTGSITGVTITGTIDNQVNWQTGSIKTTGFTATAGEGYFVNTTSGAVTATLPATPTVGDLVGIKDYAGTAATNNITIARNGSNIQGTANDFVINVAGTSVTFIYVDATQGWVSTAASKASDITQAPLFITATGGTITTSGDYKIHTFTGPGTFTVSCAGNPTGSSSVDYMVVAGGGAGGGGRGCGGGGAGGYRESSGAASGCYSRSPLGACVSALPVSVTSFPITVGAGGAINPSPPDSGSDSGNPGSNSVFSTITSAGGGGAGGCNPSPTGGQSGGSGGGGSAGGGPQPVTSQPGTGNTPPVSPPQGNNGGIGAFPFFPGTSGGGGGGATAVGANVSGEAAGNGGAGATSSINTTPTTRAGGGGGGSRYSTGGSGGSGGGGNGRQGGSAGSAGTTNTGGGGGGGNYSGSDQAGYAGGSGIVIIRYKFQ